MSIFERIAIGCANWNRPYNGSQLSDKEIGLILGYCQSSGIDTLDMATAYGNDFSRPNSYFNKIIKVQNTYEIEKVVGYDPYCIMAHGEDDWDLAFKIGHYSEELSSNWIGKGISLYSLFPDNRIKFKRTLDDPTMRYWPTFVQCPYSLYDRRFESIFPIWKEAGVEIHARSIFLRGKIIEDGIPAEEAIKFCLANQFIDKIIIGADSFDQLRRNLDFVFKWKNLEKHDEALLDTRTW